MVNELSRILPACPLRPPEAGRDFEFRIGVLFYLLFLLCPAVGFSQGVSLSARTDSTRYRIGDWIDVRVEARIAPSVENIQPAVKDSIGPFEILKIDHEFGTSVWDLRLTTFDITGTVIPPIEFVYRLKGDSAARTARTNPVSIGISTVAVDPKGDIKDIKPPLDAPWKFEDWLPYSIVAVAVALAGAAFYFYRRYRKRKGGVLPAERPKLDPHQQALSELREVEDRKLWQQGKVKEYYSEVTEISRRFFEGRWNIVALEMTTDETMRQMKSIPQSLPLWKQMMSFFTTADLVKFAKYQPTVDENEKELQSAYEIVRAMAPPARTLEEEKARQEEVASDR